MKIKEFLATAFLFVLSTTLILIWFKKGLVFGGGDVGLPTINPQRILQFISHIWWEASAPGFPRPQGVSGIPFYFLLSLMQKVTPSYVVIQALTFWWVLFLMGLGMYLVSKSVFGKEKVLIPLLSAILYLFNPFMMVSVWHRFVHTTFFLAATLPYLFIFWRRWISIGKVGDLIIFSLINILGAIIFSTLGFVVSLWIFLIFVSLFMIFIPQKSLIEAQKIIIKSMTGFIVWVLISLWWILPIFFTSQAIYSKQHSSPESVSTLLELSRQTAIPFTLQGINPFYLFEEKDWGGIYERWYFLLMPFFLVAFAVLGFIRGLGERKFIFWSLFFLVSIIFAKGAAAPFGGAFVYLFDKFFVLGVLRNPFEKIGIFIPFTYAILIPLGLITIFGLVKKLKLRYILVTVVSIMLSLILTIWHWPFWQGKLFGNEYKTPEVQIPSYYSEANNWISQQDKRGRILHLPLVVSEAVSYSWQHGYSGVEPSQVFFTSNPSLAQGFNLRFLDDALRTLQVFLSKSDLTGGNEIRQLFKIFGIRYVVLHLDMDPTFMDVYNPEKFKKQLDKFSFLKKQNEFGKLIIYEVLEENPIVYMASSFDSLSLGNKNQFWPWFIKNRDNQLISGINLAGSLIQPESSILIAYSSFDAPPERLVSKDLMLDGLPSVRILPTSFLYNLIRLKEYFETYSIFGKDRISKQILFSSKRLVEAVKLRELDTNYSITGILQDYSDLLDKLSPFLEEALPYEKSIVEGIFTRQENILDSLANSTVMEDEKKAVVEAKENLAKNSARWGLQSLYSSEGGISLYNRRIFTFQVSEAGEYEILVGLDRGRVDEVSGIALNGKPIFRDSYPTNNQQSIKVMNFAKVQLESGYHELSYLLKPTPQTIEPFSKWLRSEKGAFKESLSEMSITSDQHEPASIQLPLMDFIPGDTYTLQFEFWVQKGKGPIAQLLQDNDPIIKGKREMKVNRQFDADKYNRHWQNAFISFEPRMSANEAIIKISVEPWNDCSTVSPIRSACITGQFREKFDRESTIVIRNMAINRSSKPEIFLKTPGKIIKESTDSAFVDYERENPSFLKGKLRIEKPEVLVFAETFDQHWKLELFKQGKKVNPKEHVLVNIYANGWVINDPGEYEFTITYWPQKVVSFGGIISLISLVCLLLWYVRRRIHNG